MTEKRFEVYYSKSKRKWYVRDNTGEIKCFGCADSKIAKYICNEWTKLNDENEQLKTELKGMEELLNSYRKTIKHDAELLADATKNGYLPPIKGGYFE